jgi:hypothetical protein
MLTQGETFSIELVRSAIGHKLRFEILLFDDWYLSEALVAEAVHHQKKWIRLLKKNRNLETNSFQLKDAQGQPVKFEGAYVSVEEFVKQIPAQAFKMAVVHEKTYWTFSLTVRIPSLGKVRLVISYENSKLTDTCVVLVTNALGWEAKRIITTYLLHWPIETFYQDGKEQLGLDEYLMRNAQAIGKGWVHVPEGAFPEFIGFWMEVFGWAGEGQSTPSTNWAPDQPGRFCQ